jgi:hypothetical protein
VVTPEGGKTDGADPPNAQDRFRDACKAVLAEEGVDGVFVIIRELMPDVAITMADVGVTNLLTELEARGKEATEEGLLRLVHKWADTTDGEVIIKSNMLAATTGVSAPNAVVEDDAPHTTEPADDLLHIPKFLDRRGEAVG